MWKAIIIAYVVIAVLAYIFIAVGVGALIESKYFFLPDEFKPAVKHWKIILMSILWPILLVYIILRIIVELILSLIKNKNNKKNKED